MDSRDDGFGRRHRIFAVVSSVLFSVALNGPSTATAAGTAGGQLDRFFGDKGVVYLSDGPTACGQANETAVQTDGKLVSAVSCPERLVRHLGDGSPDLEFGGTGDVSAPEKAVEMQADGKLVAVDEVSVGFPRFAFRVQRFHEDGSLDTGFGDNGTAIAEFDPVFDPFTRQGYDVTAADVVIQGDSKIVVAGTYNYYEYDGFTYSRRGVAQALARFNADGTPDNTFGNDGRVVQDTFSAAEPGLNPREAVQSIVSQTNGQLVVAGYLENDDIDMMAARYNPDGTLDTSFGSGGVATVDLQAVEVGRDLAVQSDGRIVLAGRREPAGFASADSAVIRLNGDGSLDQGFGSGGAVIIDHEGRRDSAESVTIQPDGRIVTGGFFTQVGNQISDNTVIGVVRYGSDGSLDESFGRQGIVTTDIKDMTDETANDVLVQADGKIVASGSVIVRYLP